MSVIVTDQGFSSADWPPGFLSLDELRVSETGGHAVDIPNDIDADELVRFLPQVAMFRIPFPSFADGRGFTLARRLRLLGYRGRLRAEGHVIADQYPLARKCGFDEIEISDALADRQDESQWQARSDFSRGDYQTRLLHAG